MGLALDELPAAVKVIQSADVERGGGRRPISGQRRGTGNPAAPHAEDRDRESGPSRQVIRPVLPSRRPTLGRLSQGLAVATTG
jgi:hypothetical protein